MKASSASAIVLVATFLLHISPANARGTLALAPSSPWQLDYGVDNCMLVRNFGEGDDLTTLFLSMYAPDDDRPIISILRKERPRDAEAYRAQFAPNSEYVEISPMPMKYGKGLRGVTFLLPLWPAAEGASRWEFADAQWNDEDQERPIWNDRHRDARQNAIDELRLQLAFKDDLNLKLGSMDAPMKAMRACLDELVAHWGLDVEVQRSLSRKVTPEAFPSKWISSGDYPPHLKRYGYQGLVAFRIIVNEEGQPTDCVVQSATEPTEFADIACKRLMRNATFQPALNSAGEPVASYWQNTIRFVIR